MAGEPNFVSALFPYPREEPERYRDHLVSSATASEALGLLRKLVPYICPESFIFDPPRLLDRMSETDEIAYWPLLFGYSNYSRPEQTPFLCRFTNIPAVEQTSGSRGAILGGTGDRYLGLLSGIGRSMRADAEEIGRAFSGPIAVVVAVRGVLPTARLPAPSEEAKFERHIGCAGQSCGQSQLVLSSTRKSFPASGFRVRYR